jgi:hypothetical protein
MRVSPAIGAASLRSSNRMSAPLGRDALVVGSLHIGAQCVGELKVGGFQGSGKVVDDPAKITANAKPDAAVEDDDLVVVAALVVEGIPTRTNAHGGYLRRRER